LAVTVAAFCHASSKLLMSLACNHNHPHHNESLYLPCINTMGSKETKNF
jgi:hypothetical protein